MFPNSPISSATVWKTGNCSDAFDIEGQFQDNANFTFAYAPSPSWATLDEWRKLHPIDLNYTENKSQNTAACIRIYSDPHVV